MLMTMKVFARQSVNVSHKLISVPFKNQLTAKCLQILILLGMTLLIMATVVRAAPHAVSDNTTSVTLNHAVWPPMKHHDIWNDDKRYVRSAANERQTIYEEDDEIEVLAKQKLYENIEFNSRQFLRNLAVNDIDNNDTVSFNENSKRQSKGIIYI